MTEARRGIDHVVLSVRDLDAAAAFFRRAGFTLTPKAEQPFGTSTHMALLDGNFIDLLGTTAANKIPPHEPGRFSLAAQHQDQLQRREGLSLVAMISDDARRDREGFVAGGLRAAEPVDVSRPVTQPDGAEAIVAFTMVVVADPRLGDAQHFIYQIRTPDTFWHATYQDHANGATEVSEIVVVADHPTELAPFYEVLVSPGAVHRVGDALHVNTAQGRIVVLPPAELARRFDGIEIDISVTRPYVAGFQVRSRDLKLVEGCLERGAVPYARHGRAVQIAPMDAFGAAIEFVAQ
jgi:catechol 2,3-dioxygenase-like lactoylglutathione lyase family enzyme